MHGTLYIGDYAYSSWSLRGWLLFDRFGLRPKIVNVDFMAATVAEQLQGHAPARTVPTWVAPEGTVVWDSLALAEEVASRHPDVRVWPDDPAKRATARSLAAEMHAGFNALRSDCPMHLRTAYDGFAPSEAVRADVARIVALWQFALDRFGGPWLCGDYSAADAFFAPVAARFATYGLAQDAVASDYVARHLQDLAFRRWRALALVHGDDLPWYESALPRLPWPGPRARQATAVSDGTPENAACPYSGKPATHMMMLDNRVFGFCNATCRDKTVADPEAWPAFTALL